MYNKTIMITQRKKLIIIGVLFGLSLFTVVDAQEGGTIGFLNPLNVDTLDELAANVLNLLFYFALVAVPLMIVIGGLLIVTAAGNTEKIEKGKKIVWWSVVGFFIVLISRAILDALRGVFGA